MTKNLIFLIITFSLAFFAYNIFYNVVEVKKNAYAEALEDIPITVISTNDTLLYEIKTELDSIDFISKINFIMADTLRKNLIKRYKLDVANKYIQNSNLPNIMKIFIKKGEFTSDNKTKIAEKLLKHKDKIQIKYNDYLWEINSYYITFFEDIFKNVSYVYWGIFALVLFYLKHLFELLDKHYWAKYFKSGGSLSRWLKIRILQSFIVSLLIVLIAYAVLYPLKLFSPYFAPIGVKILLYEFAGLFFVNLISILLSKRAYD